MSISAWKCAWTSICFRVSKRVHWRVYICKYVLCVYLWMLVRSRFRLVEGASVMNNYQFDGRIPPIPSRMRGFCWGPCSWCVDFTFFFLLLYFFSFSLTLLHLCLSFHPGISLSVPKSSPHTHTHTHTHTLSLSLSISVSRLYFHYEHLTFFSFLFLLSPHLYSCVSFGNVIKSATLWKNARETAFFQIKDKSNSDKHSCDKYLLQSHLFRHEKLKLRAEKRRNFILCTLIINIPIPLLIASRLPNNFCEDLYVNKCRREENVYELFVQQTWK